MVDGRMIEVIAAAEPVPMVTGDLARLARHNRRRHTPCHQGRGDRWLSASNQFVCSTLRRGRTSSANAGRGWRSLIRWWSTRPIARLMGGRPYVMARLRRSEGVDEVVGFLVHEGGCQTPSPDIHADRKATILSEKKFSYEKSSSAGFQSCSCDRQPPHYGPRRNAVKGSQAL